MAPGRFQQAVAEDGIGQFIEIAEQALDAGVDEFVGDAVALALGEDQARDAVERATIASADKSRTH